MATFEQTETRDPSPAGALGTARERTLEWWKQEIKNGIKYQEIYGRPQDWERFRNYYRHAWKQGTVMPVNLVFSIIRSLIPQVYFRNPRVFVTSRVPNMEAHAKVVEAVDAVLMQEMDLKRQMKRVITDAAVQGSAVGWNGYDSEYGYDPTQVDPLTGDSSFTQYDSRGFRLEYNTAVAPGMPWFQRAELESTIFPWGTLDVRNSEWVAMRVLRPLRDVKKDPKYKNTRNLSATTRGIPSSTEEANRTSQSGQNDLIEMWQIRDVKTGEIIVINLDHDKFLRKEEDEMQIDGVPMHWFVFNDDPTYPWGIPDARIIEPQQLELNEIRKLSMFHRRLDMVKILYKRGAMKPSEIEKLLDEDVGAAIGVDTDTNLADAVREFKVDMPRDLNEWANIVREDMRELTGFSRNQTGQFESSSRRTATEAKIVQGAHEIRIDERRDQAADYLESIMRNVNQTVFKFWQAPRVVQVIGPTGLPGWIQYTGEQLRGEYFLRIDPNNGAPISGETRKADATQLLQLWGAVGSNPPPPELTKYIFSNYEGINQEKLSQELMALRILPQDGAAGSSPQNPAPLGQVLANGTQGGNMNPALQNLGGGQSQGA